MSPGGLVGDRFPRVGFGGWVTRPRQCCCRVAMLIQGRTGSGVPADRDGPGWHIAVYRVTAAVVASR